MQIRKFVLLEMFSFVLIGMFSPFFHIIGSRIGTCLFRNAYFHFWTEIQISDRLKKWMST